MSGSGDLPAGKLLLLLLLIQNGQLRDLDSGFVGEVTIIHRVLDQAGSEAAKQIGLTGLRKEGKVGRADARIKKVCRIALKRKSFSE